MRLSAALIAGVALLPGSALAGTGSTKTVAGSAAAQAITPLTLVHWAGNQLRFGRIATSGSGTVTIDGVTGTATTAGGAAFVTGSTTSMDFFIASGDPNRLLGIVTGSGTVSAGVATMSFTTTPMLPAGYLPATGSGYFTVGGTLSVNAGQAPGTYTGSYSVTVTYQ
jgi:hypothetical protein